MMPAAKNIGRKLSCLASASLMLLLSACASNKYEEFYSPLVQQDAYVQSSSPAKLLEIADKKQFADMQNNGEYVLIGTSSFYDLWVPRCFALECAKKHGASLVMLAYERGETVKGELTVNVPTSQTTYHSGTAYSGGRMYNFYGSSTTYGSVPVTVQYQNTYYQQYAFFFAERKNKNAYGVYFKLPDNIPGNKDKSVRVALVVVGSPAEKAGIKRGDIVKSINGNPITRPDDVTAFMDGKLQIHTLEVSHE